MRGAEEEPRDIKAYTQETSNVLKAHQGEKKNVKLTGDPGASSLNHAMLANIVV